MPKMFIFLPNLDSHHDNFLLGYRSIEDNTIYMLLRYKISIG